MDGWLWRAPISACEPLVVDDACARFRRLIGRGGWAPLPAGHWLGAVGTRLALELTVTDEGRQVPWTHAPAEPRVGAALGALDGDAWRYLFVSGAFHAVAQQVEHAPAEPFAWEALAACVVHELVEPLGDLVDVTASVLADDGVPAGWRKDEHAIRLLALASEARDDTRRLAGEGRIATALGAMLGASGALADWVSTGARAAAAREACRQLLPLLACALPETAARAWGLLGLRGDLARPLDDRILVDEPAPAPPDGPLFHTPPCPAAARLTCDLAAATAGPSTLDRLTLT